MKEQPISMNNIRFILRPNSQDEGPRHGMPLVVGDRILMPAGYVTIAPNTVQQPGTYEVTATSSGIPSSSWSGQPPVRVLSGTFAAPAMVLSTPSPSAQPRSVSVCSNNSNGEMPSTSNGTYQRTTAKVMQAIPFVSSASVQPSWAVSQPCQQQPQTTCTTSTSAHSSTTPDSGIQSLPTSPPSPNIFTANQMGEGSVCEDKDFEDFTDMPRLLPADQEEDDEVPFPSVSCVNAKEDGASHGSECETASAPSISISPSMDSDEIVNRLLALDPEKASTIAMLIKKKTQPQRKRRAVAEKEKVVEEQVVAEVAVKAKRSRCAKGKSNATDQESEVTNTILEETATTTCIEEKPKMEEKMEIKSAVTEEIVEKVEEKKTPPKSRKRNRRKTNNVEVEKEEDVKLEPKVEETIETPPKKEEDVEEEDADMRYRLAVQRQIVLALEKQIEGCTNEMQTLHVQHHPLKPYFSVKRKDVFTSALDRLHKLLSKKSHGKTESVEKVDKLMKSKKKTKETMKCGRVLPRRIVGTSRTSEEVVVTSAQTCGRFNGEYEEIQRSVASTEDVVARWSAPSLNCGCTKGACTSDEECVNRALRVQCSASCSLPLCANKKFWREDTSRLTVSNGPKSKRCLRTRSTRRAGEFVCEFAGEVVTSEEAMRRASTSSSGESRMLCIGANLFVDATRKANLGRFVKHSCRPNCRLEVWSVNGFYRAGIFTLFEIASGSEITIDKNHLLPTMKKCHCGLPECREILMPAKNALIRCADVTSREDTRRRFLMRNKRRVVNDVRERSGLPTSWTVDRRGTRFAMQMMFDAVAYRVRNIDGSLPYSTLGGYSSIRCALRHGQIADVEELSIHIRKWLDVVDDDDIDHAFVAIRSRINEFACDAEKREKKNSVSGGTSNRRCSASQNTPTSSTTASSATSNSKRVPDMTYLESEHPVSSYDPDDAWLDYKAQANDNAVRCICGALDEDGEMLQCDACHFWLHSDCVGDYDEAEEYKCEFCHGRIPENRPSTDVELRTQPDVRFKECVYYKALVNRRGIQVRLNETVYVNKEVSSEHKVLLKNLQEVSNKKNKKEKREAKKNGNEKGTRSADTSRLERQNFERKDTRIFRVERLFTTPGNNRFVFGCYYAWPHETYADTQRLFSVNEVFATPLYDTLPLDEIIGRCIVLDKDTWCKGRPTVPDFKEEDVFACEFQLDKNQRCFEKVPPKNRYPINTQPYVFRPFSRPQTIVRDFRPYTDRHSSSTPVCRQKTMPNNCSPATKQSERERRLQFSKRARNLRHVLEKMDKSWK